MIIDLIVELETIFEKYSYILIELYNITDTENLKSGKLNQSVGIGREMDFVAFLKYFMKIKTVGYYFSNKYQYDMSIRGELYSIKHQTGDSNSGITFKWTNADNKYLDNFKFNYHLIIISINRNEKIINIYLLFSDILNEIIDNLRKKKIKIFNPNERYVSFSAIFIKYVKEKSTKFIIKSPLLGFIDKSEKALEFRETIIHNLVKKLPTPQKLSKTTFNI